ncbi:MAG: T9SS type A sorting domain-containing protein [Bacteroidota bacterium]
MAKNITSLFVFLFLWANISFTQHIEFPEYDVVWKEHIIGFPGIYNRVTTLCKDTVVNGIDYKEVKVYRLESGTDSIILPGNNSPIFLRTEGQQVFVKYDTDAEELLYDFSLETGDSIVIDIWGFPEKIYVDSVRHEAIAGLDRKVIYLRTEYGVTKEYWIEGIGSNYGLLNRGVNWIDAESYLLCFEHLDRYVNFTLIECFFPDIPDDCDISTSTENDFFEKINLNVYPNPATEIIHFSTDQFVGENYKIELISFLGTKIKIEFNRRENDFVVNIAELNAGIYFIKIMDKNDRQIGVQKFIKI